MTDIIGVMILGLSIFMAYGIHKEINPYGFYKKKRAELTRKQNQNDKI